MGSDIPCRVSADLSRHERELDERSEPVFDIHDAGLMHDLLGNDNLAQPVQALLQSLEQIEIAQASFGADPKPCLARLLPELRALRRAVENEFRSL